MGDNKIIVKKMPKKPEDCPYADFWEMTGKYKCKLQKGLFSRCDLDMGGKCGQLVVRKESED